MKKALTLIFLVGILYTSQAQPGSTGGTGGFDDEPQDAPLDGGIIILAIAGAVYGYKKIRNSTEKHL